VYSSQHIHNLTHCYICFGCFPQNKNICRNLRFDVSKSAYVCGTCRTSDFLHEIDLLGNLLRVHQQLYMLCLSCLALINCKEGDFATNLVRKGFCACNSNHKSMSRKRNNHRRTCSFCNNTCIRKSTRTLDAEAFCMETIHLCKKHYVPDNILVYMHEKQQLWHYTQHRSSETLYIK